VRALLLAGLLLLTGVCAVASACTARMMTPRQAADAGLVSHPEFAELRDSLARLERQIEILNLQLTTLQEGRAADREGERDDMEKVLELVAKQVEELKAEIAKGRPR
jgi:enoyl-CoA hydratase/carnithine racemase